MAQFKRIGGKIFGVQFNKKEQEAMNKEINRQIAEREQQFFLDYDCMVLWTLHAQLGFGKKSFMSHLLHSIKNSLIIICVTMIAEDFVSLSWRILAVM